MGYTIVTSDRMTAVASMSVETDADVNSVMRDIADCVKQSGASAVFGVFAAPVQSAIWAESRYGWVTARANDERLVVYDANGRTHSGVGFFAAWNISRTPEGGKPTFQHKRWCQVGWI